MTIDQIREIVLSPDAIMRKEWGKVLLDEIDRLTAKLEEGEKAEANLNILCYISLDGGIISRGKACEFMGIDRADLDEKLGEIQLGIAKRNIDLVDFYQHSKI